jgi:hypothetical protein
VRSQVRKDKAGLEGRGAYNRDAAEVTLQIVPVVTVISAEDLILNGTASAEAACFLHPTTHLDVEEVFHSIQDLQGSVGHDLQTIWCCLLDERRDSLIRGRAVV